MSRRPKPGRPILKPHVFENAGELTMGILQNFLTYKYCVTRHQGLDKNFTKLPDIASKAYRHWIEGRGVNGKWQRYLNRLTHEMDEFYRNPESVAVLLFGLIVSERWQRLQTDFSPEDIAWLKKSSAIGEYCKYPHMYPRPEDRFLTDAMALGDRLGLFETNIKEKAVKQLLTKL